MRLGRIPLKLTLPVISPVAPWLGEVAFPLPAAVLGCPAGAWQLERTMRQRVVVSVKKIGLPSLTGHLLSLANIGMRSQATATMSLTTLPHRGPPRQPSPVSW